MTSAIVPMHKHFLSHFNPGLAAACMTFGIAEMVACTLLLIVQKF